MERNIKTFKDLECWKKCKELRVEISGLVKLFPDYEKYDLTMQMRRASRSATYNIAEGYGRFHHKENIQFCRVSRGSLYELLDQIDVAFEEEYITIEKFNSLNDLVITCIKILNGYIKYLKKAKDSK